ncbi:hypothetical protein S1OALGB6SA_310 [Olavius algarvensis spirochete endosymbiont]|uniref:hypothetical protein n=1 Tax=Olavius algarvensis spirochete endosymbiont TaxID=260710 RepID=UPI00052D944A|nr:hypothetical protein [Olavius algarvensis spirochete endosymbiont]KGM42931.1 hypothetical protein JY97_10655 [Alkalispirochaeta odontotermitis]VDA99247.1 hypothetical protein S1OALGB6SA_310 [Olavius algarvensis spirochete endosymbiont]
MSATFSERAVFGEWLVRKGRLKPEVLEAALEIQNKEKSNILRGSPRLLGQILLDDFKVFRNRMELNSALVDFEKVKAAIMARKEALNIKDQLPPIPQKKPTSPDSKKTQTPMEEPDNRKLFGQFLIDKRKINHAILAKALNTQDLEQKTSLRKSFRLLGEILMDDYGVFSNRVELNRTLIEFNMFKAKLDADRLVLMQLTREDE